MAGLSVILFKDDKMSARYRICNGHMTIYGDIVLKGAAILNTKRIPLVAISYRVYCPQCHGYYQIQYSRQGINSLGVSVARQRILTNCAVELMTSQQYEANGKLTRLTQNHPPTVSIDTAQRSATTLISKTASSNIVSPSLLLLTSSATDSITNAEQLGNVFCHTLRLFQTKR